MQKTARQLADRARGKRTGRRNCKELWRALQEAQIAGRGMEAIYRAVLASATTALLAGCAAQSGNRTDTVLSSMNDAQQSLNACIFDTYNDPQFEPLGTHMPMNMRGVSMDQLTDEHFAT